MRRVAWNFVSVACVAVVVGAAWDILYGAYTDRCRECGQPVGNGHEAAA